MDYPAGTIAGLATIPSVVALKDAAFNVDRTVELLEEAEKTPIKVLTGNDTFILEAMLMGSSGALIGFAGTATAEWCACMRWPRRQDHRGLRNLERARAPRPHLLAAAAARDYGCA